MAPLTRLLLHRSSLLYTITNDFLAKNMVSHHCVCSDVITTYYHNNSLTYARLRHCLRLGIHGIQYKFFHFVWIFQKHHRDVVYGSMIHTVMV